MVGGRLWLAVVLCSAIVAGVTAQHVLADAPTSEPPVVFDASLSGAAVLNGVSGDLDGAGFAVFELDPAGGRICYLVAVTGVELPTALQIRVGDASSTGPHLLHLDEPVTISRYLDDALGWQGCLEMSQDSAWTLARIPDAYVQVYSVEHPWGAVRGQVGSGVAFFVEAGLVGADVIPEPGPELASGVVDFTRYGDVLCHDLAWRGAPGTVTGSIHVGARGEVGPAVLDLELDAGVARPGVGARGTELSRCVRATGDLLDALRDQPGDYYVELTRVDTDQGVVRGQVDELPPFTVVEPVGQAVVDGGDPDGTAAVGITLFDGILCEQVETHGTHRPTGLRLRKGDVGTEGPVIHDAGIWVDPFVAQGEGQFAFSACRSMSNTVLDALLAAPERFYVEITTVGHPLGALRAQLG